MAAGDYESTGKFPRSLLLGSFSLEFAAGLRVKEGLSGKVSARRKWFRDTKSADDTG